MISLESVKRTKIHKKKQMMKELKKKPRIKKSIPLYTEKNTENN